MEFLDASKTLLVFPEIAFPVATINNRLDCPSSLCFIRLGFIEDMPSINHVLANTPESYIVNTEETPINQVLLDLLAEGLESERILEFEDPCDTAQSYLVTAIRGQQLQIAVFKLHLNTLTRTKKIKYLKEMKKENFKLLKDYQTDLIKFQFHKKMCALQESAIESEKTHQKSIEYHISSAYSELESTIDTSRDLCMLCMANIRDVLVLPCAHLVVCQFCLDYRYSQEYLSIRNKKCFVCQTEIKETKLVNYP